MATARISFFALVISFSALAFDFSGAVDEAVAKIDIEQWYRDTEHIASYNRYYQSADIENARDWLQDQFSQLGLATTLETIDIDGTAGQNIVAEIRGQETPEKIYIVGAHYDSISEDPNVSAPGAEDNASGTAGLLAIARAFIAHPPKSTIRFIAFSGEEAGLYGSIQHVDKILRQKEDVRGVLIMDMIGFSKDDDLDALIETSSANQDLVHLLKAAGQKYSNGRIETSFNYWGSDHVPFIDNNFNAALLIENDYDEYDDYHKRTDLVKNLNKDMALMILNMLAGTLGYWVL